MPETHTTIRNGKRLLWYTESLWKKAEQLVPFEIEIAAIEELDKDCWFDSHAPTIREVLSHFERVQKADLGHPIILNDDGSLMDGGHRLCKAILEGRSTVKAVRFSLMPVPDEISRL